MKLFIDIGHPAHVHYYKNLINILRFKGHEFFITARDKDITLDLLRKYDIPYCDRGNGEKSLFGKSLYLLKADYFLYKKAREFNPDLFLSFSSAYAAHASKLMGKPHIAFDDTEHAKFEHMMYVFFTDVILTPNCFQKDFGKKHIRLNSYMEMCYLHSNYFTPDSSVLDMLGLRKSEKYVILRFVSWEASHDIGHSGFTMKLKRKLVNELSKHAKVFISSEDEILEDLKKYQIKISPEKMHDVLAFASIYIGEGATMASECAMLGTPAVYVNSLEVGYCKEQEEKYGLVYGFKNSKGVLEMAIHLLQTDSLKQEHQKRKEKLHSEKIDVTAFMVWFIENYPSSVETMKSNPNYQYNFT